MISLGIKIDDRYRVNNLIAIGGMAEVYDGTDIILGRNCAIKIMKEEMAKDPVNIKRFNDEILTCASLDHPNIIHILNHGNFEGRPYIINEYIKGDTLAKRLDFVANFSFAEANKIMLQLTDAVSYIHKHGIIHRDIKPQNVFYSSDSTIKLGDFGIATFVNNYFDEDSGSIVGSVHYLAPEISNGEKASFQSDIYALGVTFFELLTGTLPFDEGEAVDIAIAHIKKEFPSPKLFNSKIPDELNNIILKATKKSLSQRYKTVDEMHNDILDLERKLNESNKKKHRFLFFKRK